MKSQDLIQLLDYEKVEIPKIISLIGNRALKRISRKKDIVIAVSGDEGIGKSTLCMWLGIAICKENGIPFTLTNNMIYTDEMMELRKKIKEMPIGSPLIPDEAIKFLYKLNWASKGQKYINVLYTLCRKERKITILPIPRFVDINEYFRNHRVRLWIHIVKEGYAIIFSKDWSPFSYKDPWLIQENEKMISKIRKRKKFSSFTLQERMSIFRRCQNFVLAFKYPELPESIYGQYELLSRNDYKDLDEMYDIEDMKKEKIPYKIALKNMIKEMMGKGYDYNRISFVTGLSLPRINNILMENGENGSRTE